MTQSPSQILCIQHFGRHSADVLTSLSSEDGSSGPATSVMLASRLAAAGLRVRRHPSPAELVIKGSSAGPFPRRRRSRPQPRAKVDNAPKPVVFNLKFLAV
jgi:hypothetical protein